MRPVADIDREIAVTEARLRALHSERRKAIREKHVELIAEFDAGKNIAEIAGARGLAYGSVQGVLFRAGRTQSGRTAIKDRLRSVGADQSVSP